MSIDHEDHVDKDEYIFPARPCLMERFREPKNRFFFSGRKTRRTEFGRQPYHDQVFQIFNNRRMVARCGTRKRFRGIFASSLDYMKLVAPEHLSPCRSSMVLATRETRHICFTLLIGRLSLGVVFSSRWLRRSRSSTAISQTTDGDYPPRPRRDNKCGCAHRNCEESGKALVADTITTTSSRRLVVIPEACRGG